MRIAITGPTGFIGKGLALLLLQKGHEVLGLSRNTVKAKKTLDGGVNVLEWSADRRTELVNELEGIDAFVNLAGENIGSSRWTAVKRNRIMESRLSAGKLVTGVVGSLSRRPKVLVQASAVGIYGSRGEEVLDEKSSSGEGFLADVVRKWEESTKELEALGIRRVIIRSGVVFARDGGAFPKLVLPYRLVCGTVLGSGRQWVPWIDYSDELEAIYFLLTQEFSAGAYNLVSPNPGRMEDICSAIGLALHRPTIAHVPERLLRLGLGRMAEETILTSQKVVPVRLAEAGFGFRHAGLKSSVAKLLTEKGRE